VDSNYLIDILSALAFLGHQARYRPAVARDSHHLAPFHLIQDLGQMRFRFGRLDIAHGCFDQSF
jgi:hypothetical protein